MVNTSNKLNTVSKSNPCPHCGKPDWCYSVGELTVCKRGNEPAQGWCKTSKTDREGSYYYALEQPQKKVRPKGTRYWVYLERFTKKPFVLVCRTDNGEGGKPDRSQERWNEKTKKWVKGLAGINRDDISVYRYHEIRQAIKDKKPIFIVEGEPCADALWNLGLAATTNIGGAGKWRQTDTDDLVDAEQIILCPDRDKPGLKHMEEIAENFPAAKWLYAYPDSPFWEPGRIAESKGLDVADWVEDYSLSSDEILKAIEPKRNFHAQPIQSDQIASDETPKFNSKLNKKLFQIENGLGSYLSYNLLKKQIEFDNKPITDNIDDQGGAKLFIAQTLDLDIGDTDALAILNFVAKKSPYHPVRNYLEECYRQHGKNNQILDNIAFRYFGTDAPLHQIYIIKHLVAACKRIFEPGCKYDTILILQGETGARKSTFFKELHGGGEFFTDSVNGTEDKDSLMALDRFWCCEYGEFEGITRRKEKEELKRFLSRETDVYRAPYARTVKPHPRSFVFAGTANRDDFLNDETGTRRYMVIPVQKETIPIETLKAERDRIWGAAMALYRAGVSPELSREDMKLQKTLNEDFSQIDPWQDAISDYVRDRTADFIPSTQILEKAIGLDTAQMDAMANRRVNAVMQLLGWKRCRRRINGCIPWGWVFPDPDPEMILVQDENQDHTQSLANQESQIDDPDDPDDPAVFSNKKNGKEEEEEDTLATCIKWVRDAIADRDGQTAKDIAASLKVVCEEKPEMRSQIWESLAADERETFKQLLLPPINWCCLPRIVEVDSDNFQQLREQLKPVKKAIVAESEWQINGIRKGDFVHLKSGEFFKGSHHSFPTAKATEYHYICDRLSFSLELPDTTSIRVDADFLEKDELYKIGNSEWYFGQRVGTKNTTLPNTKWGTVIGKKGNSLTVLWDNSPASQEPPSKLTRLSPESDNNPFWRAFKHFQFLAKGSKVKALRHPDHKESKVTNKIGTIQAMKYDGGKFLALCEPDFMLFNLEAVKEV